MFLAIDAGNSSTKMAVWDGRAWSDVVRIDAGEPDLEGALRALRAAPDAAGMSSVVPARSVAIRSAVENVFGVPLCEVSAAISLPFRMGYATPETLGADRIAAAAAAWVRYSERIGSPMLVIDAGTAITVDAISREPAYLGGAIAPGPELLRRALGERTGQLPTVNWVVPSRPIGTTTTEAIQSGLTTMFADGVAGLIRRAAEQLGETPLVVATGGWAEWLADQRVAIDHVAPTLVMDGIRVLCNARAQ